MGSMRELREAAWERQRGLCAATGLSLGDPAGTWHLHHRLPGGMGGSGQVRDRLSNLIAVLGEAHNFGSPWLPVAGRYGRSIHTDPVWSRSLGLLLSQHGSPDPATRPVLMAGVGWVFLTDDGRAVPVA
jgi:hypothetical protein